MTMFSKPRRAQGLVALCSAAVLLLSACGSGGSESNPDASKSNSKSEYFGKIGGRDGECSADKAGGDITLGTQYEAQSLDPINPGSVQTVNQTQAIYGTLMLWNADTSEFEPNLAEGIESNDDHTVWTLTLRDDVTFGDGTPLDGAAVVAAFKRWSSGVPTNAQVAYRVANIASVKAVDATTVEFKLKDAWVDFPWLMATIAGQIPNPAVSDEDLAIGADPAAGAGAFQLDRWDRGDRLVLSKKDDWWGGPVCLDTVTFVTPATADARAESFEQGELQGLQIWPNTEISGRLIDDGIEGETWALRAGFTFNMRNDSAVTDAALRVALQQAVDPKGMSDRLTDGYNAPETTLVPTVTELGKDLKGITYDPEAAKSGIEKAKEGGWDGKLTIISSQIPADVQFTNQLAAYLKAAGVDTTVEPKEIGDLVAATISGEGYDISLAGGGEMLPECLSCGLDAYVSDSPAAVGFSDPEVDELSATFDATSDLAEREALVGDFQEIWNRTAPRLVWGQQFYLWGWDSSLKGVRPSIKDTIDLAKAYVAS